MPDPFLYAIGLFSLQGQEVTSALHHNQRTNHYPSRTI